MAKHKDVLEAERVIGKAIETGADELDLFGFTGITSLSDLDVDIADATSPKMLDLNGTQISDISLIAGLKQITELDLSNTKITDLSPIAGLNGITTLFLDNTKITDFSPLSGLQALRQLHLENTAISDLHMLPRAAKFHQLDLKGSKVTDLRPLRDLTFEGDFDDFTLRVTDTPAARSDPKIAEIDAMEDPDERVKALLAYVATLPPDIDDVPPQTDKGLQYGANDDGILDYRPALSHDTAPPEVDSFHSLILTEATTLRDSCESGRNIPFRPLAEMLNRYILALTTTPQSMNTPLVWKVGNDLRLMLKTNQERRNDGFSEMPPLDVDMRNTLDALVQSHNVFCDIHLTLKRFDRASIDPLERHKAEQNRQLLDSALKAFATQVALMRSEIITDLQDLHREAQQGTESALRALAIEQESIENLIKAILVQGVLEAKDPALSEKIRGDLRGWAVGSTATAATMAFGPEVAANFPQLVSVLQPYLASLLTAWHGSDYPMQDVVRYVANASKDPPKADRN